MPNLTRETRVLHKLFNACFAIEAEMNWQRVNFYERNNLRIRPRAAAKFL